MVIDRSKAADKALSVRAHPAILPCFGATALLLTLASCDNAAKPVADKAPAGGSALPAPKLLLTNLERQAAIAIAQRAGEEQAKKNLEAAARAAMKSYLFDPFSARFEKLRPGRNGALCGKYNAKNRYGAYTGFKDFVVSKDKSTVYTSDRNDGIATVLYGGFAEAYLSACASGSEKKQHAAAVKPLEGYEPAIDAMNGTDSDYDPFEGL
jgi:hypothetical protein